MKINDRVYGEITIDKPVLLELINSKPLKRLKGINQAGASQYAIENKTVTRYEHSLGVMILLKKLGASMEEQVAGLLHDIPHTAFSHVIDFVFPSKNHDFHEKFFEKIIMGSEIPGILNKYSFNISNILEEKNFTLLERELPDLCADRIDYTLRDITLKYCYSEKINNYLRNFILSDNKIIMADIKTGKDFAEDYMSMDETVWSNPREVALFKVLADAIKLALEEKILSLEDLFSDDSYVYNKLKNSKNKYIQQKLDMLNRNFAIKDGPSDYDFHTVNKLRYIDPECRTEKGIKRVSELFPEFKEKMEKHKDWIKRGNYTKIVSC